MPNPNAEAATHGKSRLLVSRREMRPNQMPGATYKLHAGHVLVLSARESVYCVMYCRHNMHLEVVLINRSCPFYARVWLLSARFLQTIPRKDVGTEASKPS